jgi:hypothetical protein
MKKKNNTIAAIVVAVAVVGIFSTTIQPSAQAFIESCR